MVAKTLLNHPVVRIVALLAAIAVKRDVLMAATTLLNHPAVPIVALLAATVAIQLVEQDVISPVKQPVQLHAEEDVMFLVWATALNIVSTDAKIPACVLAKYQLVKNMDTNTVTKSFRWEDGRSKSITFIVTKDCQLACKYCYLIGKNSKERMSFSVAKKAIDYILSNRDYWIDNSVVWDFIGGEPFLEIDLIDRICDYIKEQMFLQKHPWFDSYRFNFSTNGLTYNDKRVQEYIKKNRTHLSIGITIDGTKKKHDLQRIYKITGDGSYDHVVKNIPLWLEQFPDAGTKVTIAHDDLPFIKESVLHLYSLGIKEVNINVVFEDVWKEGDDLILENQLEELADEIIDNRLYKEHSCSFFSDFIGKPMDRVKDNQNWCGAGKMLSIDSMGNFYPCTRFAKYSLANKEPIIIGNVDIGIDENKLRPFHTLTRCNQSNEECIDCKVATGCAWCQGANYDFADSNTIFQRTTYICKMHKARVRANKYFWDKLNRVENEA